MWKSRMMSLLSSLSSPKKSLLDTLESATEPAELSDEPLELPNQPRKLSGKSHGLDAASEVTSFRQALAADQEADDDLKQLQAEAKRLAGKHTDTP